MIKAMLSDVTGMQIFVMGLSALNVDRLKEGKPILFDGKPYGFDGMVCICYGETEAQIELDIKGAFESRPKQ